MSALACLSNSFTCGECGALNADTIAPAEWLQFDCGDIEADQIHLINKVGQYLVICEATATVKLYF